MKKRVSASNVMRVVSILGIICLLALQYVWWMNAYRAVEMDIMSKSEACLKLAIEKSIMFQIDSVAKGIKVVNEFAGEKTKGKKIYAQHSANNSSDLTFLIEEGLNMMKRPVTKQLIDKQYSNLLNEKLGFIPTHTLQIYRLSYNIDSIGNRNYNRIALGSRKDTIYQQVGFKAYASVVVESPITFYIKKGSFILIISILLVLLVGAILILQYISMQRDRKFADFIIDYTRMITHDLRTPVSGVQMIFKMFQKNQFPEPEMKEKYVLEGLNLTKKILLNLDNILLMAKSEQRELPVHKTDVNIRDFMEETVKMYRERDYDPKTVTIDTHYEPESFNCKMDFGLMENVVCNLMENAIKFTGLVAKITIICKIENDVVEFRFRDNGMGMAEEDQKRIFEIFEQGSANKNKHFPGFGIGLHFVQRVVKAHGGKITVKSEVNKGTEFIIRFFS